MENNNKVKNQNKLGLVLLRKAISILDFIIANEATEQVRVAY